jgi:hypothetical protein
MEGLNLRTDIINDEEAEKKPVVMINARSSK